MSWFNYKTRAENLEKRTEMAYNLIGGQSLFFWIHDSATFTLSFAFTDHYTDILAVGGGAQLLSKFFYAADARSSIISPEFNYWSAIGMENVKNIIVTGPEQQTSKRKGIERIRQPYHIINALQELKKEGIPFVFLYKMEGRSGTQQPLAICEAFPQLHTPVLTNTAVWEQLLKAEKILPPPRMKFAAVNRVQPAKRPRFGASSRHLNSAAVGSGLETAEIREWLRQEYLKPLEIYGVTDDLIDRMKHLMSASSSFPPTVVLNDDDELQLVIPDFSGEQETLSNVPVLHGEEIKCRCTCRLYRLSNACAHVGLITKYEDDFRGQDLAARRVEGIAPVDSKQGKLIAYAVHGKVVRVMTEKRQRKLSCSHCQKRSCSHVGIVEKYEKDFRLDYLQAQCLRHAQLPNAAF